MSSHESSGGLVPARITLNLTVATTLDDWRNGRVWDQIDEALDVLPHVFGEGGAGELMEAADLVADSPLDTYIKRALIAQILTEDKPILDRLEANGD